MEFRAGPEKLTVNVTDRDALMVRIAERFQTNQGFAVATLNMDHLVKLRHSAAFRAAYRAQDFVVADGNPIVWLSRLAKRSVSLAPGSDLVLPLARVATTHKKRVALIGSTKGALMQAKGHLLQRVPGLEIVLCVAPEFGFDPEGPAGEQVIDKIRAARADFCFLALGAPKQETFAARARKALPTVGFASIGAGLDFLAGTQSRAPKWVRDLSLEWAWRLVWSPTRLAGRYARCFAILPVHMIDAIAQRMRTV